MASLAHASYLSETPSDTLFVYRLHPGRVLIYINPKTRARTHVIIEMCTRSA